MRYCANCQVREATHHVTVEETVVGPQADRKKLAQFSLCEECERRNRQVFARDREQAQRVARLLCEVPKWRLETVFDPSTLTDEEIMRLPYSDLLRLVVQVVHRLNALEETAIRVDVPSLGVQVLGVQVLDFPRPGAYEVNHAR